MSEGGARSLGLLDRLVIWAARLALRLLGATLRIRFEGEEVVREALASGRRLIVAGWHGSILLGVIPLRRYRPAIMISRSRDGERIARLVEPLGWRTIRGSSSRGGAGGLVALLRELDAGSVVVHVVDGPRGPARRIKPGLLFLAQRSGAEVALVATAARRRWKAPSWDGMLIPLPFTTVWFRLVPPVRVSPDLGPPEIEALRQSLEKRLEDETGRLDLEIGRSPAPVSLTGGH